METTDVLVIGAGPAGLSAAIYARRALLGTVVLERESAGGQMLLAPDIENYPGYGNVAGYELADSMRGQALGLGAELRRGHVLGLGRLSDGTFECIPEGGNNIRARSVILAMGAQPRRAGFANEAQLTGHGVSYCSTCDGMFYRNKHVFVVGGGDSAAVEALHLAGIASSVTMVVRKPRLAASRSYQSRLAQETTIGVRLQTVIESVDGSDHVTGLRLRNVVTGKVETLDLRDDGCGVFVAVGRKPSTECLSPKLNILDEQGYVRTDEQMRTGIAGLFAAGDVRAKTLRQIVTACSDGAIAAESAIAFLGLTSSEFNRKSR